MRGLAAGMVELRGRGEAEREAQPRAWWERRVKAWERKEGAKARRGETQGAAMVSSPFVLVLDLDAVEAEQVEQAS